MIKTYFQWKTNRKSYMASRMAPALVTLNDLEGHSPVVGFFKCNPSNICAVFYQISTDSALARSLSDSWASCWVIQLGDWCCSVIGLQEFHVILSQLMLTNYAVIKSSS